MKLPVDKSLQIRAKASAGVIEADWVGELVRCRDCKYYRQVEDYMPTKESRPYCMLWMAYGLEEDDYCSHGETVDSISPNGMTWEQLP